MRLVAEDCLRERDLKKFIPSSSSSSSSALRNDFGSAAASAASVSSSKIVEVGREDRRRGTHEEPSSRLNVSLLRYSSSADSGEPLLSVLSQRSVNNVCSSLLNCCRLTFSGRDRNHRASSSVTCSWVAVKRDVRRGDFVNGLLILCCRDGDGDDGESSQVFLTDCRLRLLAAACWAICRRSWVEKYFFLQRLSQYRRLNAFVRCLQQRCVD